MKRIIPLLCGSLLYTWTGLAQVKYSNEFLTIGVGARALAMGGSAIALASDGTAGYWNPANLVSIPHRMDVSLMHAEYFAGLAKYDYGGLYHRLDARSAISLNILRFGVDDIPNTLELIDEDGNIRYDRITTFSAADLGILMSYARKTGIEGLDLGGTVKLIYRRTGEFAHAWGFGLDAAVSYAVNHWRFAAVARDVTGTFNAWSFNQDQLEEAFALTGNDLPENSLEITVPRLSMGAAREFRIADKFRLAVTADLDVTFDGRRHVLLPVGFMSLDPGVGAELNYSEWLFVRLGAGNIQRVPGFSGKDEFSFPPNLGLGVRYRNFFIDYALTNLGGIGLGQYSNIISLRYELK